MKSQYCFLKVILCVALVLGGFKTYSQVSVTSGDTVNCSTTLTVLTSHVEDDVPIDAGIVADDIYSPVQPIGFTFNFYGTNYTQVLIGANAMLCFDLTLASSVDPWPITAGLLGNPSAFNAICGPWCDIDFADFGGTCTYSTDGSAPNRKYVVTYCSDTMFTPTTCPGEYTTSQIILYETSNIIEVHIAHKTICTGWNGGHAICGVQNATGTAATVAPGRDWTPNWVATDEAWRFTPVGAGTSYTVSSIPYAPIPLASSPVYWYNATTSAFLGTGPTLPVSPATTTTYKAGALGCADTSFGYYTVTVVNTFTATATYVDPIICGAKVGSITLHGMTPGAVDTVNYSYGGVPQPTLFKTVRPGGTVFIDSLCAGAYTNITVKDGPCISVPLSVTLTDPPIAIVTVTPTPPTPCGTANGALVLRGLYPSHSFTVAYNYNGTPQSAVSVTSSATGSISLTGLCGGTYDNIVAGYINCSSCATPPVGPFTLTSARPSFSSITDTDATACGVCDGKLVLNGLLPVQTYSVSYSYNGTPQPTVTLVTDAAGSIVLTGLCSGLYNNIIAQYIGCDTCITTPAGPFIISFPPPPPVNLVTSINPTECGLCNGTIKIASVTPFTSDTVSYLLNGLPQPPVIVYAAADSGVYLSGLCAGAYSGIQVKVGPCIHSVPGTATLISPTFRVGFTETTHFGCPKDTVFFTNTSASSGPLYYTWNFGDSTTSIMNNPTHIYAQGVYSVTLVATNHHCTDSAGMLVSLVHPIHAGFKESPASGIICQKQAVAFTDSSTATGGGYYWSFGNGASSTLQNPSYVYNNTGTYRVVLIRTDFVPCFDTASAIIHVDSTSPLSVTISDSVICKNTYVTFVGNYTNIGSKGVVWNFGDGDSVLNQNPVQHQYGAGTYNVTLSTHYRVCRDTAASVHVKVQPGVELYLGEDTSICPGSNSITLRDNGNAENPLASWMWNTGQKAPAIVVTEPGYYWATVTVNNCQASDTVWVRKDCYMNIPNVFTPNGDGLNDYFFPRQMLTSGLTSFKMDIFNRWGQLVFESTSLDGRGWDGTFNGTAQPEGVFVYVIDATFKDGQKEHHQGNITLLR
jgi:gliding motility-associated-like protein